MDAIFPPRCLLCGEACAPGEHVGLVCPSCVASLPFITGATCERCGIELISERRVCTRCRSRDWPLDRNVALFPYLGPVRELIHLYKMGGRRSLGDLFAELLAQAYSREYRGLPVVPVPGRPAVRRKRGWEHVDLIAERLGRGWGVPVQRCLARTGSGAQKVLDYEGRLRNIAGMFALRVPPRSESIVLLDDILTTGATLAECARVLKEGGAKAVSALTIAVDE